MVAFRHRQHIAAEVVHLAHRVIASLVLLELDAPAVELLDHVEAVGGIGHHRLLIHDAVVGNGDFLDVLLGRGVAGNDGIVEAIHAHRDRTAALHMRLVDQQDLEIRVLFLCLDCRHRATGATTDHHQVEFHIDSVHDCSLGLGVRLMVLLTTGSGDQAKPRMG
ncbi:hypothetical protein SDC9_126816 [bioreactor metagenome]|uniref:NAD-specific glutamate dehydrogenase n=1 Tax=bioreactor metagenome TaxID=1076179 RepID=A0A645CSA5_9ZZZZ